MKKLILLIGISLLIPSLNVCYGQSSMTTLNGYSADDANKMVNAALKNPGGYSIKERTNVWFSKSAIYKMDSLLNDEIDTATKRGRSDIPDGIRVYFAKDFNGDNIIIVSTRSSHNNPPYIHQDYFRHNGSFLALSDAQGTVYYGKTKNDGELSYSDLYNFSCPNNDNCITTNSHYISCAKAISWINNYTTLPDTIKTSEWFDMTSLDALNYELQHQTNGADGVRIYFAKKVDGAHCFIFVTTKNVAGVHTDYYECLAQNPPKKSHTALMERNNFAQDNGEQCPTNCSGVTWP